MSKEIIEQPTLYKHYAIADDNDNVIRYDCDVFGELQDNWYYDDEYPTKDAQQRPAQNADGIYTHHIVDSKIEPKTPEQIAAELILKTAQDELSAAEAAMGEEMEDIIDAMSSTARSNIKARTLDKYNLKKDKRAALEALKNA